MIEQSIVELLINDAPPGFPTLAENRVYAVLLPEQCGFPALSYQLISTDEINSLDGSSQLDYCRVQFDAWARTLDEANRLSKEVRDLLEASEMKGLMATKWNEFDAEALIFRVSADFMLWQKTA